MQPRKRKTHNHANANATPEHMHTITPERVSTLITRQHTGTITRAPAHRMEAATQAQTKTQKMTYDLWRQRGAVWYHESRL